MKQVFLRHKNGNGKIFGNSALVTADTFLDRASSAGDDCEIYNSRIIESVVTDHAVISNAEISGSLISDDARVMGGTIKDSTLAGQCRVWGEPVISDSSLSNVSVFGTADVAGFRLDAFVRIHAGVWRTPPRFERLSAPSLEVTISECIPGYGHIGCWCFPYEAWFRPGYRQRIGKVSGWTPELVELTYQKFQEWSLSPSG